MNPLNALERTFINRFQGGFPLVERPFSQVANQLGWREAELIDTVDGLLRRGVLSRFGPLFDAERLGGAVTLAAQAVPAHRYEEVAAAVNSLPAVAHNYRREHRLNMWFVLACETPAGIATALREIERCTGLQVYDFPRQQAFYLGLFLHVDASGRVSTRSAHLAPPERAADEPDAFDRRLIRATQGGLPLCPDPWSALADSLDSQPEDVLLRLRALLAAGVIRRVGAVPNHYRLGLRANGMSVWDVPDAEAEALGAEVGALDFVSHCYLRPRHPDVWPYNLFAMVHGQDRAAVYAKARKIEQRLGRHCRCHDILFSTAVLKKTGLQLAA